MIRRLVDVVVWALALWVVFRVIAKPRPDPGLMMLRLKAAEWKILVLDSQYQRGSIDKATWESGVRAALGEIGSFGK